MTRKRNQDEEHFLDFILENISTYVANKPTERNTIMSAIYYLSQILFCEQTPLNIKEQCEEIDDFAAFLKNHAMRCAIKS